MKKILILVVLFFTQMAMAQIDVKLSITNLKKMKGNLAIEFYRNVEKNASIINADIYNRDERNSYAVPLYFPVYLHTPDTHKHDYAPPL